MPWGNNHEVEDSKQQVISKWCLWRNGKTRIRGQKRREILYLSQFWKFRYCFMGFFQKIKINEWKKFYSWLFKKNKGMFIFWGKHFVKYFFKNRLMFPYFKNKNTQPHSHHSYLCLRHLTFYNESTFGIISRTDRIFFAILPLRSLY